MLATVDRPEAPLLLTFFSRAARRGPALTRSDCGSLGSRLWLGAHATGERHGRFARLACQWVLLAGGCQSAGVRGSSRALSPEVMIEDDHRVDRLVCASRGRSASGKPEFLFRATGPKVSRTSGVAVVFGVGVAGGLELLIAGSLVRGRRAVRRFEEFGDGQFGCHPVVVVGGRAKGGMHVVDAALR